MLFRSDPLRPEVQRPRRLAQFAAPEEGSKESKEGDELAKERRPALQKKGERLYLLRWKPQDVPPCPSA